MPRKTPPQLAVVRPQPANAGQPPPMHLGEVGANLWRDVVAAYEFSDRASYETLAQACAAADRAARCAEQIDKDGEMIRTKTGLRDHPLIKHELAARAFVVRTLGRLGLDLEPVRSTMGRPGGRNAGWSGDAD
jgi:phage terminase small subunit